MVHVEADSSNYVILYEDRRFHTHTDMKNTHTQTTKTHVGSIKTKNKNIYTQKKTEEITHEHNYPYRKADGQTHIQIISHTRLDSQT